MSHLDLNGYFLTRLLSLQDDRTMFTLDLGLSSTKKLSAEPGSQVMALWAKSQWGKPTGKNLMDKKGLIIWSLSLTELCSDLASFFHSDASLCVPKPELILNGVRIPSAAGSPSGSGATVPSISGGRWNIAQLHPWLHFPTPSYPMMLSHWQAISATLSYLSGFLVAVRVERLSPVLFFLFSPPDKLNFTSSGVIKPFVSKTVTQPLGELNSIPPSLHPPS